MRCSVEDAAPAPEFVTYKRADGDEIWGEYAWMTDTVWVEESDEDYFEVVKETWALVSSEVIKFGSTARWCDECDEDVTLSEPHDGPVFCPEHVPPAEVGLR